MVQCFDAYKRQNGDYLIIQEDDGRNKNLMYIWTPDINNYPVISVSITPANNTLTINESVQLTPTIAPANASNRIVSWSSSNPSIATVSKSGLVRAIAPGIATITVTTAEGLKTASVEIMVILPPPGTWIIADDIDPAWNWSGYNYDYCKSCFGDSEHSTNVLNSFATYSFVGTEVETYCDTWDEAGFIDIYIDDILKGSFDQNLPPYGGAKKIATITGLTNETHTIKFVANSTNWVGIDYIQFRSTTTLPLNLISFKAQLANGKPYLNWTTENEVNISHFEIERSNDGINFVKINRVESKGGGIYNFLDNSPLTRNNYYQLKMVDLDGKYEISKIQVINFSLNISTEFSVYPNPNNGYFTIFPSKSTGPVKVTIFDQQGRVMFEKEIIGKSDISVDNLSNGFYIIQLNAGGFVELKKMLKQNNN